MKISKPFWLFSYYDEVIEQSFGITNAGEIHRFGSLIRYIAESKLKLKEVPYPAGPVKIRFDKPSGEYLVLFTLPE